MATQTAHSRLPIPLLAFNYKLPYNGETQRSQQKMETSESLDEE